MGLLHVLKPPVIPGAVFLLGRLLPTYLSQGGPLTGTSLLSISRGFGT